jgi:hypothetical protein
MLIDADSSLDHVFFPDSGVISAVAVYSDGSIIEMATIGREGCAGVQAVFGAKSSSSRFFVQISGSAAKISRVKFTRAIEPMPSFQRLTFAYVRAFLGHGVGGMQRCAQSEATISTLAVDDARPRRR